MLCYLLTIHTLASLFGQGYSGLYGQGMDMDIGRTANTALW